MKFRIWVFDDEKMIRDMIGEFLREFGYEVFCFQSPAEIAENLNVANSKFQADIVITDIQMPEMDGIEFVKRLTECGFSKENIAMISGYWTEEYREFADKVGVRCFDKPFGFKEVLEWVKERRCEA
ncbi:Two component system response regulator [Desulfonema limicola]|uniref:Two component system response regulator n=2 Tax=Desulfonema limicola TaxID=45656 RepID=A0A975B4S3_9BACT|nr:Two component system response regulator [Desulfonema limicola]